MDEREGTGLDTTSQWSGQKQDKPIRSADNNSASAGPARIRKIKKLEIESLRRAGRAQMNDMRKAGADGTAPGHSTGGTGADDMRNIRTSGTGADDMRNVRTSGTGADDMRNVRASGTAGTQGGRVPGSSVSQSGRVSGSENMRNTRASDTGAGAAQGSKIPGSNAPQNSRGSGGESAQGRSSSAGRRHPNGRGMRRSSRARRRRRNLIFRLVFLAVLLVMIAGGAIIWRKYGPSKEEADLKEYYGLENENDLAVIINNEVIREEEGQASAGKMLDGQPYVEYSVVRHYINERFYWDPNESVMLYTLPNGNISVTVGSKEYTEVNEKKSENYVILKTEGRTAYIALPFIQQYTNMDFSVFEKPDRAAITCKWGEIRTAALKKNTEVRYQGGVKSPILTKTKKSDKVTVLEDEGDWQKVATIDGFVGYVKTNALRKSTTETTSGKFIEPEYSNISVNHTINMAWHNVDNPDANSYMLQTIADTKGLNTIAPTWFSIADTEGNLTSIASSEYVNYAHQSKLDVWGVLRDFHGGISSYDETYEVLSYTSKRENLINKVIAEALQSGIDGINLDFELISTECGEHYIQFIRELSVKCRQNGLVFSVDNYVPQPYNEHRNLKEQGIVADYIMIMGYDEHTEGSYEAGSVSSYGYVKEGIENALKEVPNSKLVVGIPFYTRLWQETDKTQEQLEEEQGTEAAMYSKSVTSTALGMDEARQTLEQYQIQAQWDNTTRQNYAEWESDGGLYKIWLEDEASLEEKMKLITSQNLAGVAEWSLGMESSGIWDLILQYIN